MSSPATHPPTSDMVRQALLSISELESGCATLSAQSLPQLSHRAALALAIAGELSTRLSMEGGESCRALGLANDLQRRQTANLPLQKARLLEQRKRRRRRAPEVYEERTSSTEAYIFPGQDKAQSVARKALDLIAERQGRLPLANTDATSRSQSELDEALTTVLHVWRAELCHADAEAAASVTVSLGRTCSRLVCVRLEVDQLGTVMLWTRWTASSTEASPKESYEVFIEQINVLSESEWRVGDLPSSAPSSFPLYRQISAQLFAKVAHYDGRRPSSLVVLVATLFAVAGLCHLHDPFPSSSISPGQPARGTAAILDALANWSLAG